jgi:hypothetical protein
MAMGEIRACRWAGARLAQFFGALQSEKIAWICTNFPRNEEKLPDLP